MPRREMHVAIQLGFLPSKCKLKVLQNNDSHGDLAIGTILQRLGHQAKSRTKSPELFQFTINFIH